MVGLPGGEARPFVKWAGGKRQLLDALIRKSPSRFNRYFEPFLGGGALYFKLWSTGRIKKAYLNDFNEELINSYLVVQKRVGELIEELRNTKYANTETAFYKIRAQLPMDAVERAARFVYLNKTAYNGLYRVNSKGGFNVPFGRYANPNILDEANLLLVSDALAPATITCGDFDAAVKEATTTDYIYFDPPYCPVNRTSSFTAYTKEGFSMADQERLRDVCSRLINKGVHIVASNSDTRLIRDLYNGYETTEVYATRAINCKAEKRGRISELVITRGGPNEIPGIGL